MPCARSNRADQRLTHTSQCGPLTRRATAFAACPRSPWLSKCQGACTNDTDRLRKYLAKFDLDREQLQQHAANL